METQLSLIPASEHPTALESQWLNAISPADFINNNKNFDVLMMRLDCVCLLQKTHHPGLQALSGSRGSHSDTSSSEHQSSYYY